MSDLRSAAGEDGGTWITAGQRVPMHKRVRDEDHQCCHVVSLSSRSHAPLTSNAPKIIFGRARVD